MLGHEPNVGTKMLDEETGRGLVDELRDAIVALPVADWAADPSPIAIARLVVKTDAGRTALATAVDDDRFFLNLLAEAGGVATGQALGAAAVERTPMLNWDFLLQVVGEELLRRRVAELTAAVDAGDLAVNEDEAQVLPLAACYTTGWRPDGLMQALIAASTGTRPAAQSANPDEEAPQPDA
jgi:hypothetical protein